MKKNRVGEKYITNEGYEIEIIEYFGATNITVKFSLTGEIVKNLQYSHIKRGLVANFFHPSVYGIGYFGRGFYNNKQHSTIYDTWRGMLRRCYAKEERYNTYKDVTVCEEWHNFQNFAKWYEDNYVDGYEIDKDIICSNCRIYNPETCCFVPQEINKLLTNIKSKKSSLPTGVVLNNGVYEVYMCRYGKQIRLGSFKEEFLAVNMYKTAKEEYIKEVADKWKDKIDIRVYNSLINL